MPETILPQTDPIGRAPIIVGLPQAVEDAARLLQGDPPTDAITPALRAAVRALGFDAFVYHHAAPTTGLNQLGDWPQAWVDAYERKGYVDHDPVVRHLLKTTRPFTWDEAALAEGMGETARVLFNAAAEHGIAQGGEVPIHGPPPAMGVLSVYMHERRSDFSGLWRGAQPALCLLAPLLHDRMDRLLRRESDGGADPGLSAREIEVLSWCARGKTVAEIGTILDLSPATVRGYVRRAAAKLGTAATIHAVALAVLHGLVRP